MTDRVLFANGCSMCYGTDLFDDPNTGFCFDNEARWRAAWPGQLGRLLGYTSVVNDGFPGSSNDRILRSTIRWLVEDVPALKAAGAELLVVIGWSSPMRREFHISGEWRQLIPYHDYTDAPAAMINRAYREIAWSDEESAIRFATQVLTLKWALERASIPYLFFNALESLADIDEHSGGSLQPYMSQILDRHFLAPGKMGSPSAYKPPRR